MKECNLKGGFQLNLCSVLANAGSLILSTLSSKRENTGGERKMNIKFICDVKILCWRSTFLTKSTMVTAVHFDGGEFLFIDINCECTWPAAAVVGFNQLLLN